MKLPEYLRAWNQAMATAEKFSPHYSVALGEARFLFDCACQLRPLENIVELGVCNGRTAAILASAADVAEAFYFGVDNFSLESSAEEIRGKFHANALRGTIVEGSTQEVGKEWKLPVSLLFIDAGHDEGNVRPDTEIWLPHVVPGGIVAWHDYGGTGERDSDAHWAVKFYADAATAEWEEKGVVQGLFWARKPVA